MKPASTTKTALILVDVQNGFLHPTAWGTSRSTPDCEANISHLLLAARHHNDNRASQDLPTLVCHVAHHSIDPLSALHPSAQVTIDGHPVPAVQIQRFAAPREDDANETFWTKDVNSAFVGTGLEAHLRAHGVRQLVICGLTTDHCVSTTTRMAANLRVVDALDGDGKVVEQGEGVVLVGDACATFAKGGFDAEVVHRVNLASLDGEFARVVDAVVVSKEVFGS